MPAVTNDLTDPSDVLARTCWGEARNQGHCGMQAIANVVMNRAADPGWWGKDIVGVCLRPFQFSCWLVGDPNREKLLAVTREDRQFAAAQVIAERAIQGTLPDLTHGATSYYERHVKPPGWSAYMDHCCDIGDHRFYRPQGAAHG